MKGLEISREYYERFGKPMIDGEFSSVAGKLAVGLFGSGSECFGFDDETSRDHDFDPGFCIILPGEDEVDRKTAFAIERAYAKLPKEFCGLRRSFLDPVGGNRRGVVRAADFFSDKVGRPDGLISGDEWFAVPESFLAEAVNGEVFRDEYGAFSAVRAYLSEYPPDVRLKKLAGRLLLCSQSGQYNYARCLGHGESGAAQLSAFEFVNNAMHAVFLLNGKYMPYYKWSFRAMRGLEKLADLSDALEHIISTDNSPSSARLKTELIEDVCGALIGELKERGLTDAVCGDLEKHAYSVNDRVSDPTIRNRHILSAV